jgi:CubicO group peptidase (beta-lactamase class C family)
MKDGKLTLDEQNLMPTWKNDPRGAIKLSQLLGMESGLEFQESYGSVTDVTRMLFLQGDMAKFAASARQIAAPGQKFSYSSGSSVLLSRIWMDRAGDAEKALMFPHQRLFQPLGMNSAVFEVDASGTYVGSSYLYATARDWARFGLLLAQDGVWQGQRILPEGFVARMTRPTSASGGRYNLLQAWSPSSEDRLRLPSDTFMLQGHDGQTMFVMPSKKLVIVRMGFTPSRTGYRATELAAAIARLYP